MLQATIVNAIAFILALGLLLYVVGIYNQLHNYTGECMRHFANVDVLLVQRHSELTKLIDLCRHYMKHESTLLLNISKLRSEYQSSSTYKSKVSTENTINTQLSVIVEKIENYPELKANYHFSNISKRTTELDTDISIRREAYNSAATHYNVFIQQFPINIIATIFRFKVCGLLNVESLNSKALYSEPTSVAKSA